ncbi:MAG: chalcone isomerase family protein [Rhizobiales bacterium]|nr:chalcone isomerase family protein [Hyphomicrobiales bacterium]
MHKHFLVLSVLCLFFSANSPVTKAEPITVKTNHQKILPGAKKLGSGRLTYLGWSVYDASLYSQKKKFSFKAPFALTLKYHMAAKADDIAKLTIQEMRNLGLKDEVRLAAWYRQMLSIFPNVKKGTELTGVYNPEKGTQFFLQQKQIGSIKDKQFGKWFFKIWLSENTSFKELRLQLLGS